MKRPLLEIQTGELSGKRFEIKSGGIKLGRASTSDVCIPDAELSRAHCIFEPSGEDGIRLTDLASANGTRVNGEDIGVKTVDVKAGDIIEVGTTVIKIVKEGSRVTGNRESSFAKASEDRQGAGNLLRQGSGGRDGERGTENGEQGTGNGERKRALSPKRSLLRKILWGTTVGVMVLAFALVLLVPSGGESPARAPEGAPEDASIAGVADLESFAYEKVEGDSSHIFRFFLSLEGASVLRVKIDEVGGEERHLDKMKTMSKSSVRTLAEIFAKSSLDKLDDSYSGPESEPPRLDSLELVWKTGGWNSEQRISVVNTVEPAEFKEFREKLETFAKNELAIWALEYSAEKLMEMAKANAQNARVKYEDRDVNRGNLFAAVRGFEEALVLLETVNPKPREYASWQQDLDIARRELDLRYRELSFQAAKAQQLQDWQSAAEVLGQIMETISDHDDDRYDQASKALIDVERRLRKGGK